MKKYPDFTKENVQKATDRELDYFWFTQIAGYKFVEEARRREDVYKKVWTNSEFPLDLRGVDRVKYRVEKCSPDEIMFLFQGTILADWRFCGILKRNHYFSCHLMKDSGRETSIGKSTQYSYAVLKAVLLTRFI